MNKIRLMSHSMILGLFILAGASLAQAQATRTWVSGVGNDADPCSRTAPCKTFAGAYAKTAVGGEIDALDPGGYGTITIGHAITIDGGGTFGSILAAGTIGINVNAGANDVVTLRNIWVQGVSQSSFPGITGIRFNSGGTLNVENCVIENFTTNGIETNLSTAGFLNLRNTVIRNCAGDGLNLFSSVAGNSVKATLVNSSFVQNGNGLHARSQSRVTARDCVFSNNGSNGVFVDAATGGTTAFVRIWASQISNNSQGVLAGLGGNAGTSTLELAQNQIDNNIGSAVVISTGGTVETFSNNSIRGNGGDGCGGCTPVGPGN